VGTGLTFGGLPAMNAHPQLSSRCPPSLKEQRQKEVKAQYVLLPEIENHSLLASAGKTA
jgi:hypothetical protein